MRQQQPSLGTVLAVVLLLAIGLGALLWFALPRERPADIPSTVTPTLQVIVLPSSTAAGAPVSPSPTAPPSHTPGAVPEPILTTPTALPATRPPTMAASPTMTATPPPDASPEKTMVQRG